MSTMTDRQSVAANATVVNALSGKKDEFIRENSLVRAAVTGAAVGLFFTFIVGDETVVEDQEAPDTAAAPVDPDDFVSTTGLPGDRVILKYRNSTGAAIIARAQVKIDAV